MAERKQDRAQKRARAQQIVFAVIAVVVIVSFVLAALVNY